MEKKTVFEKKRLLGVVIAAIIMFAAGMILEMDRPLITRLSDAFMLSGAILIIFGMISVIRAMSGPTAASVVRQKFKQSARKAEAARKEAEAAAGGEEDSDAEASAEEKDADAEGPVGTDSRIPTDVQPVSENGQDEKKVRVQREALLVGIIEILISAILAFIVYR